MATEKLLLGWQTSNYCRTMLYRLMCDVILTRLSGRMAIFYRICLMQFMILINEVEPKPVIC